MELKERERSIDLNSLNKEEAEQISEQLGSKVRDLVDHCISDVNRLLNIYGLEAKMQIVVQEKGGQKPKKARKPRAKKA